MTYIPDLHKHGDDPVAQAAADPFILDDFRRKKIKAEIEEIINEEFDRLSEFASSFLSETAADRATKFLLRVLKGDEGAILELIGGDDTRYHLAGYDKGKPWAQVIHGRIFETTAMKLRREIVEANADLLSNERIKDLESVVEGLQQQTAKLQIELDRRL